MFEEVGDGLPRWSPESHYAKEMRKWNTTKSQGGMRPDGIEEFPKMLFKARRKPSGGPIQCIDPGDDKFTSENQRTVGNREEEARAERDGWRQSPEEAVKYAKGLDDDVSTAAAERAQRDRKMSPKARAEAAKADAATADHLAEIPETPVVRRQKRKNKAA